MNQKLMHQKSITHAFFSGKSTNLWLASCPKKSILTWKKLHSSFKHKVFATTSSDDRDQANTGLSSLNGHISNGLL